MSDLLKRLRNQIAAMAPEQKQRHAGRLLIEATDEIEKLANDNEGLCEWHYNMDTNWWESECGEAWSFEDEECTPESNGFLFCPSCGRRIVDE